MGLKSIVVRRVAMALFAIGLPLVALALVCTRPAGAAVVSPGASFIHIAKVIPPGVKPRAATAAMLQWFGGPVMHQQMTYAIYWLPPGSTVSDGYTPTLNQYFADVNDSPLYNILTQYPDAAGAPLDRSIFGGFWTDTTDYPPAGTYPTYTVTDLDIQDSIARAIAANPGWQKPGLTTMYFVFTGFGVESCQDTSGTDCSHVQYCAYHGSFRMAGKPVIYANMPYNVADAGCGDSTLPPGDADAMVQISTLAHEQFEAANDPLVTEAAIFGPPLGWYSNDPGSPSTSGEIGDLCNQLTGPLDMDNANVTLNGNRYKIQSMWSNAAGGCALTYAFPAFIPKLLNP
jgi:hypothetical protein